MTKYPAMTELVPHQAPMLLVDELLAWTPEHARVGAKVRAGGPFVVDGRMAASFCLEYMAQAIAAAQGMGARLRGDPASLGVLLGSRELRLEVDALEVGDQLEIEVDREYAEGGLARYACRVLR
ncbi:MAG: hypothetical protein KC431_21045, partial [Myxococcales bacterium]|nr:hypothetical protein [Myxococcales bacterium]